MITLVGLGNTGVKIIDKLSDYKEYNTIPIDVGAGFKEYKTPEEYEDKCPSFKKIFKSINGEVFLFVSASGIISGAILRILEQLKGNILNVVCIHSDPATLSRMGTLQQKVVSSVLQEYTRSGLIENLYLLDNSKIEDLLDDIPLDQYWEKINEVISYFFHTFMCFRHMKPIFESKNQEKGIANIKTFGLVGADGTKKMLYDLQHVTVESYNFSYSKEKEKDNKNYLKEIKSKMTQEENMLKTFKIFESNGQDFNTYIEVSTHIVQYLKV